MDLQYEWAMARHSAVRAIDALAHRDHQTVNMALESLLIHARNIRDFFDRTGRSDDVLASDFLGRPIRVRMSRLRSKKMRQRLNKRIAHLSYARARLGRSWDIVGLMTEINGAMEVFTDRLRAANPRLADIVAAGAA